MHRRPTWGLVVFGAARLPDYPDVPSVKELGYDAEFYGWMSIMAPRGTPAEVVAKLRGALAKLVQEIKAQDCDGEAAEVILIASAKIPALPVAYRRPSQSPSSSRRPTSFSHARSTRPLSASMARRSWLSRGAT